MKIMIVDDEALTRLSIRSMIPWGTSGYTLAGEAENGKEALQIARANRPDIILVDIVMPEMDGMELIKLLKFELPACKFIIISCMNEVDYYKSAISLGVCDYLLKSSFDSVELMQILERASDEIEKGRIYSDSNSTNEYLNKYAILTDFANVVLENRINDEITIRKKFDLFDITFASERTFTMAFTLDYSEYPKMRYDGTFDDEIVTICQVIMNRMGGGYIFKNSKGSIILISACPEDVDCNHFASELFTTMHNTIVQYFDLLLTAGVSGEGKGFSRLHEEYQQACSAIDRIFYNNIGMILYYSDIACENEDRLLQIETLKKAILSTKSIFEMTDLVNNLEKLYQLVLQANYISSTYARELYTFIVHKILELLYKEGIREDIVFSDKVNALESIPQARTLGELHENILDVICQIQHHISGKIIDRHRAVVNRINEYIESNLNKKISLADISRATHFSRAYICRLYKKETGGTLLDYIIERKIEKSKEMLISNLSISQIGDALGFISDSYFIKVFKTHTGSTPMQFIAKRKSM